MKHRFDKKTITQAVAYFCATLSLIELSLWLNVPSKESEAFRYLQQCTYVGAFILFAVTLNKLRKLIPKTLKRAVTDKLLYALDKVVERISRVTKKIMSALGINLKPRKREKDEKSFVFDIKETQIFKKLSSFKGSVKWRDLTENSEKIRFIYIKYMIKQIKGGYKLTPSLTPCEVRTDLGVKDEQSDFELFDMYNGARYSGGSVHISDEQVKSALEAVANISKK